MFVGMSDDNSLPTPSVSPFLFCHDVEASMSFLERAFGFTRVSLIEGHGQARLGDTRVFLSATHPDSSMLPANQLGGVHALVMVYLDPADGGVDALFDRARAAGAHIEYEPQDMPYGQREGGIRDIDGNLWSFATLLP